MSVQQNIKGGEGLKWGGLMRLESGVSSFADQKTSDSFPNDNFIFGASFCRQNVIRYFCS